MCYILSIVKPLFQFYFTLKSCTLINIRIRIRITVSLKTYQQILLFVALMVGHCGIRTISDRTLMTWSLFGKCLNRRSWIQMWGTRRSSKWRFTAHVTRACELLFASNMKVESIRRGWEWTKWYKPRVRLWEPPPLRSRRADYSLANPRTKDAATPFHLPGSRERQRRRRRGATRNRLEIHNRWIITATWTPHYVEPQIVTDGKYSQGVVVPKGRETRW